MEQRIQPLPFEPAQLSGLSEKLLRSHHQNNYGGAVKRLNAIRTKLAGLDMRSSFSERPLSWAGSNGRG